MLIIRVLDAQHVLIKLSLRIPINQLTGCCASFLGSYVVGVYNAFTLFLNWAEHYRRIEDCFIFKT
jgi:hypothetical protein